MCASNAASLADEMERFYSQYPIHGAARSARTCIERIRHNAACLAADGDALYTWLTNYLLHHPDPDAQPAATALI